MEDAPSINVTTMPAPGFGVTVAVNVVDWPKIVGFTEEVSAVVVLSGFTTCDRADDVLPLKLVFPPYTAVMEWGLPLTESVETAHEAVGALALPLRLPVVQIVTPLSWMATVPVGVLLALDLVTVAVKVTDWLKLEGFAEEATVVVVSALLTMSVKLCVAFGVMLLLAVIVMGKDPTVPDAGVPLRTPAVVKVTPPGSAPVSVKLGAGGPEAVTVNVPADPTVNVVVFPLVNTGAVPTW
jgi:hypothetical protein